MMSEKEYIEREAVMEIIDKYGCAHGGTLGSHSGAVDVVGDAIHKLPAADVAPVKHARNLAPHFDETICTNCGVHLGEVLRIVREENGDDAVYYYQPKYCANCGAKFDGGEWVERSKRKE